MKRFLIFLFFLVFIFKSSNIYAQHYCCKKSSIQQIFSADENSEFPFVNNDDSFEEKMIHKFMPLKIEEIFGDKNSFYQNSHVRGNRQKASQYLIQPQGTFSTYHYGFLLAKARVDFKGLNFFEFFQQKKFKIKVNNGLSLWGFRQTNRFYTYQDISLDGSDKQILQKGGISLINKKLPEITLNYEDLILKIKRKNNADDILAKNVQYNLNIPFKLNNAKLSLNTNFESYNNYLPSFLTTRSTTSDKSIQNYNLNYTSKNKNFTADIFYKKINLSELSLGASESGININFNKTNKKKKNLFLINYKSFDNDITRNISLKDYFKFNYKYLRKFNDKLSYSFYLNYNYYDKNSEKNKPYASQPTLLAIDSGSVSNITRNIGLSVDYYNDKTFLNLQAEDSAYISNSFVHLTQLINSKCELFLNIQKKENEKVNYGYGEINLKEYNFLIGSNYIFSKSFNTDLSYYQNKFTSSYEPLKLRSSTEKGWSASANLNLKKKLFLNYSYNYFWQNPYNENTGLSDLTLFKYSRSKTNAVNLKFIFNNAINFNFYLSQTSFKEGNGLLDYHSTLFKFLWQSYF